MGDTTPFLLPPGTRFYPSDQQLICYYLSLKNGSDHCNDFGFNLIEEIDLYNFDPFNLPDSVCFKYGRGGRKRHWFCFVARVLKGGRRRAAGGYWKKRGRVRDMVGAGAGKVVVGTRKSFVFYLGDCAKTAVKTDWLMYEYTLTGHPMASFVLCRVFIKSRGENKLSEHVFSSCGEESVAKVHVGIQYDGTAASVADSKVHDENTVDQENDVSTLPSGLVTDLNGQALIEHVAQQQIGLESDEPPVLNGFSAQDLMAISEGDFIELDDLLCTLPGIN
ncbi:hypothetical protein RND71_027627 [Anisodus tanguticus]|uniref:NAC domain-containing protein n=1 Tax=Anisodus tanguticus TaxID=243964 RepID=A0AAE1RGY9_9SOLA|nr:hypothetical protein RND71_027627 [Anisodus tanguticus]